MAITRKTRKILWGRSGNRCAICRRELVASSTELDKYSLIGEECHIVGKEPSAARGNHSLPLDERDELENLILLCRNHHKLVDDQPNTYAVDFLRSLKARHEQWVQASLTPKRTARPVVFYVFRMDTGTQLCHSIIPADGFHLTNEQPETKYEAELIGRLAQDIQDYSDLWGTIGTQGQVAAQLDLNKQIAELNTAGFLLYAVTREQRFLTSSSENSHLLSIAYVFIVRNTNPMVERKDEEIEQLMHDNGQKGSEFTNFIPVLHEATSVCFI